jgi:hypothetical protein
MLIVSGGKKGGRKTWRKRKRAALSGSAAALAVVH